MGNNWDIVLIGVIGLVAYNTLKKDAAAIVGVPQLQQDAQVLGSHSAVAGAVAQATGVTAIQKIATYLAPRIYSAENLLDAWWSNGGYQRVQDAIKARSQT